MNLLRRLLSLISHLDLELGKRIWGFEYVTQKVRISLRPISLLKTYGAAIGNKCMIHPNLKLHEARESYHNLTLGDNVSISRGCFMDLSAPIVIGSNVGIGMEVMLLTHRDFRRAPELEKIYPRLAEKIVLEDNTIVGARAVIMPGVRIGTCSVIAPGAVVSSEVPAYSLVAGNPARVVKKLEIPVSV